MGAIFPHWISPLILCMTLHLLHKDLLFPLGKVFKRRQSRVKTCLLLWVLVFVPICYFMGRRGYVLFTRKKDQTIFTVFFKHEV